MRRRELLSSSFGLPLVAGAASLAGCAGDPLVDADAPAASRGPLTPWRVVSGGFLTPPPQPGQLPRPGTGMFVKLVAPTAIALRGPDLLVADAGSGRVWRIDPAFNHASGIAGVPVTPQTALMLGPDLSAWVLDAGARQVLRFARDGRLLQTYRIDTALPAPVALALADGGATLLVADGMGAQWGEQRSPAGLGVRVAPRAGAGDGATRVGSVDAIVAAGRELVVLDRLAATVHRVARDGRVLATLGRGELVQPSAMAVDREGRIFVVDDAQRALVVLREGLPARRFGAAELGLQRIGAVALDERVLALADAPLGQVQLFLIAAGDWP
ncbi:MAG TPA: hypothetical protein VFQ16_08800 [Burkholderiaceae bacterium]|nr:hypothetical protein [Burkholderiaceae bacterium]